MKDPQILDRIRAILATMRLPIEQIDLADSKHVGRLIRELSALNKDHPDLDEVRGLLKQHRFVNLSNT